MQECGRSGSGEVLRSDVGTVSVLRLHNPAGHSALDRAMIDALVQHLDALEKEDAVRAVVLTGTGRYFCTGASLASGEFKAPDRSSARRDGGGVLALRIFEFTKPIIAAVNGDAVGVGASILLPCDLRLAVPAARIGFVQSRRGIALEGCASWFLPRVVGMSRAIDWCVSGRLVTMTEAADAGLIASTHSSEDLVEAAIEVSRRLVEQSAPVSANVTRRMLWNALTLSSPMDAHRLESQVVPILMQQPDAKEGVSAFFQKRSPVFGGKPSAIMQMFSRLWNTPPFDAS